MSLSPDGLHTVIENGQARLSDGTAHPQAEAFAALHARLIRFAGLLARLANQTLPKLDGGLATPAPSPNSACWRGWGWISS